MARASGTRRTSSPGGSTCASPKRGAPKPVVLVTGHQSETIADALSDLPLQFVHNPDFADGLSTSLRTGLGALPQDIDGAVVMLADMPQVDAALIDRLIAAYDPQKGALIAVPVIDGKRGEQALSIHLLEAPPSLSKASRKSPDAMAVIVEDLIKMLDGLGNGYRRGRYPDPKVSGKVAAVLRAVADELEL